MMIVKTVVTIYTNCSVFNKDRLDLPVDTY